MRPVIRDVLATALVAASSLVYAGWAIGVGPFETLDIRVVTAAVLVAGIAASMVAVVPGFERLIHGSRVYLAIASVAGAIAIGAGIGALVREDESALAVLMGATIAMWAMSTLRHASVLRSEPGSRRRARAGGRAMAAGRRAT